MVVADIREILVQWDAGEELSRIARALGYSRPTVRKYVRAAERAGLTAHQRRRDEAEWDQLAAAAIAEVAHQRPPGAVRQDVARYRSYLEQHVGQVQLSVLHQRLRDEQGLQASWGSFYRYVRATWPDRMARTPQATIRLDDPPPGAEAQVDFFYVRRWFDPDAGRERKLYAFLMTLSHSRHAFLYPVLAEDSDAWLAGHVGAFQFFGGAPKRLVPDNLTAGIIKADRYDPRVNRAYGELARYYGCLIDPSRVAHPKDKARVERNVQYARNSFFAGRDFASLSQMHREARGWSLAVAGPRTHGTTGEVPLTVFQAREQAALLPLPPTPWDAVTWLQAKLRSDCHLRVGTAEYSAPYQHIGRALDVRLGRSSVHIYDGQTLLTTHDRIVRGRATKLEHYPPAGQAFLRANPRAWSSRPGRSGRRRRGWCRDCCRTKPRTSCAKPKPSCACQRPIPQGRWSTPAGWRWTAATAGCVRCAACWSGRCSSSNRRRRRRARRPQGPSCGVRTPSPAMPGRVPTRRVAWATRRCRHEHARSHSDPPGATQAIRHAGRHRRSL
jgi:transposase